MKKFKHLTYPFAALFLLGCSQSIQFSETSYIASFSKLLTEQIHSDKIMDISSEKESTKKSPLADKKLVAPKEKLNTPEIPKAPLAPETPKSADAIKEPLPPETPKSTDAIKEPLPPETPKSTDAIKEPLSPKMPQMPNNQPLTFPSFFAPEKFDHPLQHSKKLTFMIGEDSKGSYLYGEGPILEGAYQKFRTYVEHYEKLGVKLDRLMLHSPGGILNEGIQIGEYLIENNWSTDADQYMRCYSTCGFIYAAGAKKRIQQGAEVGFHRPYLPDFADTPEFIEHVYKKYQGYWNKANGSHELYNRFMKDYGRDDMYILNKENIHQYMTVEAY